MATSLGLSQNPVLAVLATSSGLSQNPVLAVHEFCTRKLGRPITRDELKYTAVQLPGGYQCSLKMHCLGGVEFAGDLRPDSNNAKLSAAEQVLLHFREEIHNLSTSSASKKKGEQRTAATAGFDEGKNPISAVNNFCTRKLGRSITREELRYSVVKVQGGYQCSLNMLCLGGVEFAGEIRPDSTHAKMSAAEQVLLHFAEEIDSLSTSSNGKKKGGGKGKKREKRTDTFSAEDKTSMSEVIDFCTRKLGRFVSQQEVQYTCVQLEATGFQSSVRLDCLDGIEFAGEIHPDPNLAKVSAADQVLKYFAEEISSMPASSFSMNRREGAKKNAKRYGKRSDDMAGLLDPEKLSSIANSQQGPITKAGALGNANSKTELNNLYSRIAKRQSIKGEVVYTTQAVSGGWQSQLQLLGLPAPHNETMWAGEVCNNQRDAERSVAAVAVDTLCSSMNSTSSGSGDSWVEGATNGSDDSPLESSLQGVEPFDASTSDAGLGTEQGEDSKSELRKLYSKLTKRSVTQGEIFYKPWAMDGGWQAEVQLRGLPMPFNGMKWAGEVCATQSEAEQSAAWMCLDSLLNIPQDGAAMALLQLPPSGASITSHKRAGWWGSKPSKKKRKRSHAAPANVSCDPEKKE